MKTREVGGSVCSILPHTLMGPNTIVLWREGEWRCEFHDSFAGTARLEVYRGDVLATAEATPSGNPAHHRANVLRQRVVRGDLTVSDRH